MIIYLNSDTINYHRSKAKLYQYLYSNLGTTYFRATKDCLSIYFKGSLGLFKTDLPCESETDEVKYFSVDFSRWVNALVKFEGSDSITLAINKNLIKMSVTGSSDVITLSVASYGDDNTEVTSLDALLEKRKKEILDAKLSMEVTEEIADDLALTNSLFVPQQDVNSIGLGKEGLIYAVRSVILRTRFTSALPDDLFANLDPDEDYIYLHKYMIGFINHVFGSNPVFNFSSDYSTIYWEDESSSTFLTQPSRELAIPSDEDIESFVPAAGQGGSFSVDTNTLKESLGFFDGFYVGSVWKPIRFESTANKEVVVRYKHPTADITKSLPAIPSTDGEFTLDSDTVRRVMMKVRDKRPEKTTPLEAVFTFDDNAPGVLCEIDNYYSIVFCKLSDEE